MSSVQAGALDHEHGAPGRERVCPPLKGLQRALACVSECQLRGGEIRPAHVFSGSASAGYALPYLLFGPPQLPKGRFLHLA
jgi:hypothetical protein